MPLFPALAPRSRERRSPALPAALAMLVLLCQPLLATPAVAGNPATDLNSDLEFREKFGLRSGETYVRGVRARGTGTSTTFGATLTRSEERMLFIRLGELDVLKEWARSYVAELAPSEYGGMFIDQQAGGILYLQLTGAASLSTHEFGVPALILRGSA